MYLNPPTNPVNAAYWSPASFHIEENTNRLMAGSLYVVASSNLALYTVVPNMVGSNNYYITCSPVRRGLALQCWANGAPTPRTQFAISKTAAASVSLLLVAPGALAASQTAVELIAGG